MKHGNQGDIIRNTAALVFNVRRQAGAGTFDYLEIGGPHWEDVEDIVRITKWHKNVDRLAWDLINIPHHGSYSSLRPCCAGSARIQSPIRVSCWADTPTSAGLARGRF